MSTQKFYDENNREISDPEKDFTHKLKFVQYYEEGSISVEYAEKDDKPLHDAFFNCYNTKKCFTMTREQILDTLFDVKTLENFSCFEKRKFEKFYNVKVEHLKICRENKKEMRDFALKFCAKNCDKTLSFFHDNHCDAHCKNEYIRCEKLMQAFIKYNKNLQK